MKTTLSTKLVTPTALSATVNDKVVKGTSFSTKRADELNAWLPLLVKFFGKRGPTLTKLSQSSGVEGALARIVLSHENGETPTDKLADLAVPVKKGRGRPRGSLNKKGRKPPIVRPYGNVRGRPPGVKNKPKVVVVAEAPAEVRPETPVTVEE